MEELHRQLLEIGFNAGPDLGLVLAGGDALAPHRHRSWPELENRGARHTVGFSLGELADRLGAITERDDRGFASYGLEDQISRIRRWAVEWESDIRERLAAGEEGPTGAPDSSWDRY